MHHDLVLRAARAVTTVAAEVNETVREAERRNDLVRLAAAVGEPGLITPHRALLLQQDFLLRPNRRASLARRASLGGASSSNKGRLWLCTDLLLLGKPSRASGASLSRPADWKALPMRYVGIIVAGKMVLLPGAALLSERIHTQNLAFQGDRAFRHALGLDGNADIGALAYHGAATLAPPQAGPHWGQSPTTLVQGCNIMPGFVGGDPDWWLPATMRPATPPHHHRECRLGPTGVAIGKPTYHPNSGLAHRGLAYVLRFISGEPHLQYWPLLLC